MNHSAHLWEKLPFFRSASVYRRPVRRQAGRRSFSVFTIFAAIKASSHSVSWSKIFRTACLTGLSLGTVTEGFPSASYS